MSRIFASACRVKAELTLFRVLQEALTNIHRHSGSRAAEVTFDAEARSVELVIRDYGSGMPPKTLEQFRLFGSSGVGLAGMRERVREAGGSLDIQSDGKGTLLRVILPRDAHLASAAGD